ncbi:MAG: ABC transporter ATP-binding protein/permease [Desulfobulbaceae bacterium]|jgi:ATP-binding cassette subfamily B protein|nr:ABC transporter ATP-binding protein/permease [Desulfobulbaceae bacterium]
MFEIIVRLLKFSGCSRAALSAAFVWGILHSIAEALAIFAIVAALNGILSAGDCPMNVFLPLVIMVASVVGKIVFGSMAVEGRMLAGYDMCADKRIALGETLKRAPLGYFDDNRLGELTAAVTTTLSEIESVAVSIVDQVARGFVHALVIAVLISLYDWRAGLVTALGLAASILVFEAMQRQGRKISPLRRLAQAKLVAAVLEYVQGMAVVKAFSLGERSDSAIRAAISEYRLQNTELERSFSILTAVFQIIFKVAACGVLLLAALSHLHGEMPLAKSLLLMIASFMLYAHIEMMGGVAALLRVIAVSMDKVESLEKAASFDDLGEDARPENHEIRLENVAFSYDESDFLADINLIIPEKTTVALVGTSGGGKTTLCNLMARFRDVKSGKILLGGRDLREYSRDALLRNFSMVFQHVYLFQDSIFNNIRFGKPGASEEEIHDAARKACCHEFIMALPQGYDTMVGESGATLSGGERQRISIARAILKNAPIIILDEATASVDMENERLLLAALEELTHDKTVVMIAHRLSTVRRADQILVLDKGQIVQRGRHEDLMAQGGLYADFVRVRERAEGWKLVGSAA